MNLNQPVVQYVAHDLAVGMNMSEICRIRGLSYSTWNKIEKSPEFQKIVEEHTADILEHQRTQHLEDPLLDLLHTHRMEAGQRIIKEIDNLQEDANPNTRLKASGKLLDILGYGKQEVDQGTVVNINLSSEKQSAIVGKVPLEKQPDNVTEDTLSLEE